MSWQFLLVFFLEAVVCVVVGAWIGYDLANRSFSKRQAQREAERQMKVQREMHDAKRTHLPREDVSPTRISKARFTSRPE